MVGGPNVDQVTGGDGIDILIGGRGGDTLAGGPGDDALLGMGDDDNIDGGDGSDLVGYFNAPGGVEVDLSAGYGLGPGVGFDDLTSIESILGSPYADDLTGSAGGDQIFGNAGDDTIDGGDGNDFVLFAAATDGVIVELNVGASTAPGEGADTLTNVESALGTDFDDVFYGNGADNYFDGLEGADSAYGFGGVNVCYAEQTSLCGTVLPTTDTQPGDVETASALASTITDTADRPAGPRRGQRCRRCRSPQFGDATTTAGGQGHPRHCAVQGLRPGRRGPPCRQVGPSGRPLRGGHRVLPEVPHAERIRAELTRTGSVTGTGPGA